MIELLFVIACDTGLRRSDALADRVLAFDRILRKEPGNADAWIGRARARLAVAARDESEGRDSRETALLAVRDCDESLRLRPRNADAFLERARAHLLLGDHARAMIESTRAFAVERRPDALVLRALAKTAVRDFLGALDDVSHAVEQDPKCAAAYAARGEALAARRRTAEAMADFDRALELEPGNAGFWTRRGLLRSGKEAVADFTQAIRLHPRRYRAWIGRGSARLPDDPAAAAKDFEHAVRIAPKNPEAHVHWGLSLQLGGDLDEAIRKYEHAIEIAPRDWKGRRWAEELLQKARRGNR